MKRLILLSKKITLEQIQRIKDKGIRVIGTSQAKSGGPVKAVAVCGDEIEVASVRAISENIDFIQAYYYNEGADPKVV